MKIFVNAIIFLSLTIPTMASHQATSVSKTQTPNGTNAQGTTAPSAGAATSPDQGTFRAASNSLRILSPKVGEKIGGTAVTLQYELTNSAASAAASPTYRVQLDGRDPAETLDTEYTFTGLAPGAHTITVELVDANHLRIGGSRAVVHFKTTAPGAEGNKGKPQTTGALVPPPFVKANLPLPENDAKTHLPSAGSELPLLSMVGFGVLVGGVISAMRCRR